MKRREKEILLYQSKHFFTKILLDIRGATAVEFAMIGPVFFALIFSALDLGLLQTKIALLETAATKVSRSIYTGAASSGTITKEGIKIEVCDSMSFIVSDCINNLSVELTTISDFHSIPTSNAKCIDSDNPIKPAVQYNPGKANDIVYLRLCLTTNVYVPGMGLGLSFPKTDSGKFQIISSLAFSNEPF